MKPREATICECGDHAFSPLTKGYVALVSVEDIGALFEHRWRAHFRKNYLTVLSSNGGKHILSRFIMSAEKGQYVDHKNLDTADCRRSNLRFATRSQNNANRRKRRGKALPKGVCLSFGSYKAVLTHNGNIYYLGSFPTVEEATSAYNAKAVELFGEFARAA